MIDRLLQELAAGAEYINVYDMVMEMRQHRVLIVQTYEQYVYVHECLMKAIEEELQRRSGGRRNSGPFLVDNHNDLIAD